MVHKSSYTCISVLNSAQTFSSLLVPFMLFLLDFSIFSFRFAFQYISLRFAFQYISFRCVSFRILAYFVSLRFVSHFSIFRCVIFHFVSFRSLRFDFVSQFSTTPQEIGGQATGDLPRKVFPERSRHSSFKYFAEKFQQPEFQAKILASNNSNNVYRKRPFSGLHKKNSPFQDYTNISKSNKSFCQFSN